MDYPVQIVTGSPGSGKTYWVVKRLVTEILPIFDDVQVLTNVPLWWDETDRVKVVQFERGWLPPGDTLEERLTSMRNTIVIIDECQEVLLGDREYEHQWKEILGKARKNNTRWVFMSQLRENIFKWLDDMAEEWLESVNGRSQRDRNFGIRVYDLQNLWAKATGRWIEYFCKTEYGRRNRRWYAKNKEPYYEFLDMRVAKYYDTKNGMDVADDGSAKVIHDYMRLNWVRLLYVVGCRNFHVMPKLFLKLGVPPLGFGACCVWLWWSVGNFKSPPALNTVPDRAAKAQVDRAVERGAVAPVVAPVKAPVRSRVLTWCALLCLCLFGCVGAEKRVDTVSPGHVARRVSTPEPKVAVYGEGHSLDAVLGEVGIESHTDAVVSGPLIGREVLDAARSHGHSLVGDKLVPSRKRAVPVPTEIASGVSGTVSVGGLAVKTVDDAELESWLDLTSVVHEAFSTECLVVSVQSARSNQLSAVFSSQGAIGVTFPQAAGSSIWQNSTVTSTVNLAANGQIVNGRVVAHPVLTSAPAATGNVHVGQRVPVMLAQSQVTNQTTTLGSTLTYVQTGTTITIKPMRVSSTQVRLTGTVTLSDQVSTINNVPVTDDRSLTVDHLVKLNEWTLLGRLDSATAKSSRGWLGIGGAFQSSDDTFVVLAKTVQVYRDQRLHSVPGGDVGDFKEVDKSKDKATSKGPEWKPEIPAVEPKKIPDPATTPTTPASSPGGVQSVPNGQKPALIGSGPVPTSR